MNLATGVDLIEIERVQDSLKRYGERFAQRVFTPGELALCGENQTSLAARFAAKEAVAKALGTGIGQVRWQEIEILHNEAGAPLLYLHGDAQQLADVLGLQHWSLSLSHTKTHALAFVVAVGS